MFNIIIKLFGGYTKKDLEEKLDSLLIKNTGDLNNQLIELKTEKNYLIKQNRDLEKNLDDYKNSNLVFQDRIEKITNTFNREKEDFQKRIIEEKEKEIKDIELKNQKILKDSGYIGEMKEEEISNILSKLFEEDVIDKIGKNNTKGKGDIIQKVYSGRKNIGSIIFEIKNRATWNYDEYDKFLEKINTFNKNEKVNNNTYIFAVKDGNKSFPSLKEGSTRAKYKSIKNIATNSLYFDEVNNIYITNFSNLIQIVYLIRSNLINLSKSNLNNMDIQNTKDLVFQWFTSGESRKIFQNIVNTFNSTVETINKNQKNLDKLRLEIGNSKQNIIFIENNAKLKLESKGK